jgi:hemin uptake protein HemP
MLASPTLMSTPLENQQSLPLPGTPAKPQVITASQAKVVWDSQALLSGQREVFIQHGAECYRLILTKSGKLILQK